MIAVKNASCQDRLQKRRAKMLVTLAYIQQERRTVEENKAWINPIAHKSRVALLRDLIDWYVGETARIDNALSSIAKMRSGICPACHKPIDFGLSGDETERGCCCEFRKTRDEPPRGKRAG